MRRAVGHESSRAAVVLVAVASGGCVLAFAVLAAGVPWPRALVASVVVGAGVLLAQRLPMTQLPPSEPPEPAPQSSGYHPATLLATALRQAADDPWSSRRVRPRLQALAGGVLALRGIGSLDDAVAAGLLSAQTGRWLAEAGEARPTAHGARTLRRCVDELTALAPTAPGAAAGTGPQLRAWEDPDDDR